MPGLTGIVGASPLWVTEPRRLDVAVVSVAPDLAVFRLVAMIQF